jgi:hypothetical protein
MRPIAFRDPRFAGGPVQVALRKLEAWLEERKWNLVWSRKFDDHVNYTDRMIVINANRTAQSQIFGILHEIGHILRDAGVKAFVCEAEVAERCRDLGVSIYVPGGAPGAMDLAELCSGPTHPPGVRAAGGVMTCMTSSTADRWRSSSSSDTSSAEASSLCPASTSPSSSAFGASPICSRRYFSAAASLAASFEVRAMQSAMVLRTMRP